MNRKQKSVLENVMLKCREDQRKKLLRRGWAGARLRMTLSSHRRQRWESTTAADICRTGAGVTIACADARGRERDHQRKGDQEGLGIPECHMADCVLGDEFDRLTVLVVIERYTKMVVVPSKGSTGNYACQDGH